MNELKITEKTLDIKKVFREKAPRLSKWMPGFLYAIISRKLNIDKLNEFLFLNRNKMGLEFIDAGVERLGINLEVIGIENIPEKGRYTLAANHPLGGPEGVALLKVAGGIRPDITFLANDILMVIPNLNMLFTPVNKHGSNQDYFKDFNAAFESDKMVLIFPAGLVSRKQEGKIRDLTWKSTYISRAIQYDRQIIPCHVDGKNSNFFYNLARFRERMGIKINLEMFLLSDEMFNQDGKTIKMTIGKPIPNEIFDDRMTKYKWSAAVKDYVYKLKDDPQLVFDDDYINSICNDS